MHKATIRALALAAGTFAVSLPAFTASAAASMAALTSLAAPDFAGTYSGTPLSATLARDGERYRGTITLNGQQFPAVAAVRPDGSLAGTFTSQGFEYEFTALLADDMLILASGGKSYTLRRGAAAAPANPLGSPTAGQPAAPAMTPVEQPQTPATPPAQTMTVPCGLTIAVPTGWSVRPGQPGDDGRPGPSTLVLPTEQGGGTLLVLDAPAASAKTPDDRTWVDEVRQWLAASTGELKPVGEPVAFDTGAGPGLAFTYEGSVARDGQAQAVRVGIVGAGVPGRGALALVFGAAPEKFDAIMSAAKLAAAGIASQPTGPEAAPPEGDPSLFKHTTGLQGRLPTGWQLIERGGPGAPTLIVPPGFSLDKAPTDPASLIPMVLLSTKLPDAGPASGILSTVLTIFGPQLADALSGGKQEALATAGGPGAVIRASKDGVPLVTFATIQGGYAYALIVAGPADKVTALEPVAKELFTTLRHTGAGPLNKPDGPTGIVPSNGGSTPPRPPTPSPSTGEQPTAISAAQLQGSWRDADGVTLTFNGQRWTLALEGETIESGTYTLRGKTLVSTSTGPEGETISWTVDLTGDRLILKSPEETLTLRRAR